MDALFSGSLASLEAWLMLLALIVFIGIFFFDGIALFGRIVTLFRPIQVSEKEEVSSDIPVASPMLENITKAEIRAHEKEKKEENKAISTLQEEATNTETETLEDIEQHGVDLELIKSLEEKQRDIDTTETTETPTTEIKEESPENKSEKEEIEKKKGKEEVKRRDGKEDTEKHDIADEKEKKKEESSKKTPTPEVSPVEEISENTESPTKSSKQQNTEKLYAIMNEVKTLMSRGDTVEARALIIQGLALEKNHKELNLTLGSLYESERQYTKAEYVYKDLALVYPDNIEILEKLANILIVEKRYDLSLEIYKKIVSIAGETEGSLYIMSHLTGELEYYDELLQYTKKYQKGWPNNPEILSLMAEAEIAIGDRHGAIQTLIKLKNLTPYNAEIVETINKLSTEEEMAGNFGN